MSPFTLEDIRQDTSGQSFTRGQSYYRNGAIFDTVRRGNELEGRCQGSEFTPYHIRVTLNEAGAVEIASCTCQYSWGGYCKHIVALLLAYLNAPESFTERPPVQDTLMTRSPEQLVALIRQMVTRYPDLQALVDRPVPSTPGHQPATQPVDTEPFRRELRQAVRTFGEWGDRTAEQTVYSVMRAAQRFNEVGDWRSACAIYQAIMEECLIEDHYPVDDEGEFIAAVQQALERLADCLQHDELTANDAARRAILDRLLDAFIWNIDIGGYGLGDGVMPEAVLEYAQPSDLPTFRERILAAQRRQTESVYGQWSVEHYEEFLIQLDAIESTDPEVTLQRLRDQGLYRLLFNKLLSLERIDEAVDVFTDHLGVHERLRVLPALSAAGHDDTAVRLAQETVNNEFNDRMARWLAERYAVRNNQNALFQLRLQAMQERPSEPYYAALKTAAAAIGTWETVRPEIIRQLEQSADFETLTRVYLHDEDWDAAWETFNRTSQPARRGRMSWRSLDFEVAERSRHARPRNAIPVYIDYARREIDQRSRDHYAEAASYLSVVHELYQQLDDEDAWRDLISGIRAEFRRLPALQDELNQAGL